MDQSREALFWFTLCILIFYALVLTLRESGYRREKGKLELQRASLIEKLRGLGVHAFLSTSTFTGLDFRYTKDARELEEAHFYGSAWNLERQIDYEQSQRDLIALHKEVETLKAEGITKEPFTELDRAVLAVKASAKEVKAQIEEDDEEDNFDSPPIPPPERF